MNNQEFAKSFSDSIAQVKNDKLEPYVNAEVYMDSRLADLTKSMMLYRLMQCRSSGRGGWWDKEQCDLNDLRQRLVKNVEAGNMVDVINLAAMIALRGLTD